MPGSDSGQLNAPALSELTTLHVGGPARAVLAPAGPEDLVDSVRELWTSGEDWLLLGGGSNVVVADGGFDGTLVRIVTRGIEVIGHERGSPPDGADRVRLRVQAGEPWDGLVAYAVENGWAGIEALSGIPGTVGAAPIQNIGAYGQELSSTLVAVDFLDYLTGSRQRIPLSELGFGYRTSNFKRGKAGLVVAVELELTVGAGLSEPIRYPQLAGALNAGMEQRVPLADLRQHVLALRAAKGMLLSPDDPDSVSAGSFFTNPIVSENFARGLPQGTPYWLIDEDQASAEHEDRYLAKVSAAWLIEHAGIHRGFRLPGSRAAISSKHTLAIVNTGGARADEIAELARLVQSRVLNEFGIVLQPEPVLIGVQL